MHAQLGYLDFLVGDREAGGLEFAAERDLYPESAVFIDGLLLRMKAKGASSSSSPPSEPERAASRAHSPRSILVLPPRNDTAEADAPCTWLATITRPLAERGYYVFPVAIVDATMKENGRSSSQEIREVPLAFLGALFDADAVLDVDIRSWGWSDRHLDSEMQVSLEARLVDVKSGTELWSGSSTVIQSAEDKGPVGVVGTLFSGINAPIGKRAVDVRTELARQANWGLLHGPQGLPLGPRHPGFAADQKNHVEPSPAAAP